MRKHLLVAGFLSMAFLAPSQAATVATVNWTGASGSDWNTSSNWNTKPDSTATALFDTTLSSVTNSSGTDQSVSSISFDTSAGTAGGTFTIGSTGGNKLILTNAGTTQILSILDGTGKTITINAPVTLSPASGNTAGAYTFFNNSADSSNTLNFGGAISGGTTTGTVTLTLGGANTGNNTISGLISNGSASGGVFVFKTGEGTWILGADNTFTGRLDIRGGTLKLGSNQTTARELKMGDTTSNTAVTFDLAGYSFSTTTSVVSSLSPQTTGAAGATMSIIDSSGGKTGMLILGNNILYNAGTADNNNGQVTISANIDLNSALRRITVADSDQTTTEVVISGNISSETGSISKEGAGTLVLGGTNTYTGNTTVRAGTLLINGSTASSSAVNVSSGATLGGNGTAAGAVSISGTLAPGNSIGSLNTGDLTLSSTGILGIELGRSGGTPVSDRTNVTGTVTLVSGANLNLTLYTGLTNPVTNDIFFLVINDGLDAITGQFAKLNGSAQTLSEGSKFNWNGQVWKITYRANFEGTPSFTEGNDLAIQVVPEPAS